MLKPDKENRYFKIYCFIIERSKHRDVCFSSERHHIIPKCLGGTDDAGNIAYLTIREHFICHKLLTRFMNDKKLEYAFSYMVLTGPKIRPSLRFSSRDYEEARSIIKQPRSKEWCENISRSLRGKSQNPESIKRMRETLTGRVLTYEHRINIGKSSMGRKHAVKSIDKMRLAKCKEYTVLHDDGTVEIVIGLKQWCSNKGLNYTSLRNTLTRSGSYRGYRLTQKTDL